MTARRNGGPPTRRRVIVLAESLPYPTLKGGDLRTWQNVNALAAIADVGVFGLCSNDERRHRPPPLPLACWTASTDPALAYPPPKGVKLPARAWLVDPRGHPSDLYFSEHAAQELAGLLARFDPEIVLVEGVWLHRYLGVVRSRGRRTILDCHNVEAAVMRALAATSLRADLEGRVVREVLPARTETIEREAIASVDQVWVCSREDERRMRQLYRPRTPIAVVPNGIRLDEHDDDAAGGEERPVDGRPLTLVFPGIYAYRPNAIAADFLVEEIFPRLAAMEGTARLLLVGPMPSPSMMAAAERDPRIVVTGAVPDVRPYLAAATAIAVPLFHGGGTHLKVLEAFAARLPVISTRKGAEGLAVADGVHLLLAEDAEQFVAAALAVWRDRDLARRLTTQARAVVAAHYSWTAAGARVRDALDTLEDGERS